MSDGPHRSLPLRRHWKKLAERAEKLSFSMDEVAETFPIALLKDFREAPLSQVRDIFLGNKQPSLFQGDYVSQLEAVRSTCRGSTASNIFIDCAIEAKTNGLTDHLGLSTALENAFKAHARGTCNSIEEHYKRKDLGCAVNVRSRLRVACTQISYSSIASEMLSGKAVNRIFRVVKRTGIDEGPQL